MLKHILWVLAGLLLSSGASAQNRVDQLLTGYSLIKTVSCDVRKDTATPEGEGRMLSRVWFEAPNRLLVENSTPIKRKILCDGTTQFFYADEGQTALQFPFDQLPLDMQIQAQSIPASPMEHLLRLKDLSETNLPATAAYPVRTGYSTEKLFAVLSFDASNRLARLEFYTSPEMTNGYAATDYSSFEQPLPGVWLALHQESEITVQGEMKARESRRFSNLRVNPSIPPETFQSGKAFPGVKFNTPPSQ
ncbi:MAG TPA: hypothetical protein DCZ95_15290 [Verrucomicrobia bacterium]|nr:MAG: hypothetical protein A2X46_19045 [Lentisphaerae bacterium GWF2_57_35]HBA85449.1 hypothetical protein [Verrucomicrobiota bacterium]